MFTEFILLVGGSSIDAERKTLSLFDIIDDVQVRTVSPSVVFPVQAIVSLRRSSEQGRINEQGTLKIFSPNGSLVASHQVTFTLEPEHVRCRLRVNTGVKIDDAGAYRFVFDYPGNQSANVEAVLNVRIDRVLVT